MRSRVAAMAAAAARSFSRVRSGLASLAVDGVDLQEPIAGRGLDLLAGRGAARPARKRAWASSLALRTARGSAAARRRRPPPRVGRRPAAPTGGPHPRPRPGLGRGQPAHSARRRAGAARRTGRSGSDEPLAPSAPTARRRPRRRRWRPGSQGPRSRSGEAWRRSPRLAAPATPEARMAVSVGSAPPEMGSGRRATPSPTPSVPIKAASTWLEMPEDWLVVARSERTGVRRSRCPGSIRWRVPASIRGTATGRLGGLDPGKGVVGEGR